MNLKLRKYQREALEAIDAELTKGVLRTAVVLPTGMGKTVVFAELIRRQRDAGRKVVVLVHRDELAEQAKTKVHSAAPDATIGIVKAERNEVDADVIIASVQTLARPARREAIDPETVGMIVVDECHHAAARTWRETLEHFGAYSDTPAVGFTATLYREDGRKLSDVWETVCYEREILYGIDNGFLTDVRCQQVDVKGLDLTEVRRSHGDFTDSSLGAALIESNAGYHVAQAYKEHAADRRGVLFAPTVETAWHFADWLNSEGIVTEVVTGETSKEDRTLIYKRYDAGDVQVLANCMVLTEGWDSPATSCAVIARPTQNPALYTQMVGRVLRPFTGKEEALVLDVTGVSASHKLASLTSLSPAGVQVKPGETMTEARARVEGESEKRAIYGSSASRTIDLFANSHSVWLRTYNGTWFVPVRGGQIVLWQDDDLTWRVGKKMDRQQGEWLAQGLTQEYALSWGEQIAEEIDPTVATKNRSWRRQKASAAQIDLALRLRLLEHDEVDEIRRGVLSDRLSVHFASKALDKKPARKTVGASR